MKETLKSKEKKLFNNDDFPYTNPGKRMQPVYKKVFDEELGRKVVKQVSEFDIYEYIQSSASSADMAQLRSEYVRTGMFPSVDPTLVHGAPTIQANNIHEFYQLVNGAKDSFESLDPRVKEIFGDADSYVEALLKGDANAILLRGLSPEKQEVPVPEEKTVEKGE